MSHQQTGQRVRCPRFKILPLSKKQQQQNLPSLWSSCLDAITLLPPSCCQGKTAHGTISLWKAVRHNVLYQCKSYISNSKIYQNKRWRDGRKWHRSHPLIFIQCDYLLSLISCATPPPKVAMNAVNKPTCVRPQLICAWTTLCLSNNVH